MTIPTEDDESIEAQHSKPVGAALVIGAGIAGMQAALDLAEGGIKVYLLDHQPAIGGNMAMLDKTFPTNDCAMCIMSPKLVEVGRHLNIELITCAEVEEINGEPGNFTVTIRQQPRFVDLSKCTGCGDCAAVCPVELPDRFNGSLSTRKAIYKLFPQAIPNSYAIDKQGIAPCRAACPVHQRVQGYSALIAAGRYADAYRTILEDNPFPSICGRVCNHRCEQDCNRSQVDAPVNIMALKRFVADWAWDNRELVTCQPITPKSEILAGKQVAIVGAGPAGLTCGRELCRQGAQVTIYEALPVPGGMMRVGVPVHRLPPEVVQREIDDILAEGITLYLNHPVDDVEALLDHYQAVFVAIGAHGGVKLPIPGNDLPQVFVATEFLRQINLAHQPHNISEELIASATQIASTIQGQRVLVLGGGNVAIDSAMTALRLGARWVGMTCLESRAQMPAFPWEVHEAEEEGIEIFPSRTFKEVVNHEGRVTGVATINVIFRGFIDGRPDFDEIAGSEAVIAADVVIFAIGQRPESDCLKQARRLRGGRIEVNPETLATSIAGIFAGGDAVSGAGAIVDAIAAGKRAAQSISNFLLGESFAQTSAGRSQSVDLALPVVRLSPEEGKQRLITQNASREQRIEVSKRAPSERSNDFSEISRVFTEEEALREARRCLRCGVCSECNQCVAVCRARAINHDDTAKLIELNIGAVILSPGLESVPGDIRPEYGFGRYPNVITNLQFERMLSASGPSSGVLRRPSDGKHPRKIAWIQCVGSRDSTGSLPELLAGVRTEGPASIKETASYCSSICCMAATKEALIAKEHDPAVQPTIFYIDIRSFGKGFETYIERAKNEAGVRFIRCMVSSIKEVPGKRDLRLSYVTWDGGGGNSTDGTRRPITREEEFDLVVLSVGLKPGTEAQRTAEKLGIALNKCGFVHVDKFTPTRTSRAGVFVAGAFAEPKDIPESVIEASCAAAEASALLGGQRGSLAKKPVYPPERDVSEEPARVGVFVCHCGINIGGVVDTEAVVEAARALPGVVYAEHNLYTCSQDTQERICQKILEQHLNRVVVASCTPRTHEPLFQDTLRQAGLNPHLFEMANIREQDAWVHRTIPESATQKACALVAMAVAKAKSLQAIMPRTFEIDQRALVIGGGLAGMTAALSIARQGFEVFLVERQSELGGNLRHIFTGTSPDEDPQKLLQETVAALVQPSGNSAPITVIKSAEVVQVNGYTGQYRTLIRREDGTQEELHHGVILVATGGKEITPSGYGYGDHPCVITQRQFEQRLRDASFTTALKGRSVVMVQCVGSREPSHPYCSRICCTQALKNSLEIKRLSPDTQIYILFRDLRSYGFREHLYREARARGVIFLEYSEAQKPVIHLNPLAITVNVQPDGENLTIPTDWLVLSMGIEAEPGNVALAQLLKVPLTSDGFFLEAHLKLRPVDFAASGVFLAGLAHSPRSIEETITQAQAAAMRAVALLSKSRLEATPIVASVNPRLCAACGTCVEVCPYGARVLEPGMEHAEVIDVLCQGCGACVAACPNKATQQIGFRFDQIFSMLEVQNDPIKFGR